MIYIVQQVQFVRRRKVARALLPYNALPQGMPYRRPGRFDVRFPVSPYRRLRQSGWIPQNIPTPVVVPQLVGLGASSAILTLASVRLNVGTISSVLSNTVAQGNVISQSPAYGTAVGVGFAVSFVVSSGNGFIAGLRVVAITPGSFDGVSYSPGDEFNLP